MDYFNAFWFGGLVCALIQILLDKTKLMPGRVMVLLVCSGALLSAVGIYRPLVDFAGAGASVPLIGFGHVLWAVSYTHLFVPCSTSSVLAGSVTSTRYTLPRLR